MSTNTQVNENRIKVFYPFLLSKVKQFRETIISNNGSARLLDEYDKLVGLAESFNEEVVESTTSLCSTVLNVIGALLLLAATVGPWLVGIYYIFKLTLS